MAIVTREGRDCEPTMVGSVAHMATVRDNAAEHRYEILDGDQLAGFADYTIDGDVIAFPHTETLPGHEGKGLARQLVEFALADAHDRQLDVLPSCWFVRKVIAEHSDEYVVGGTDGLWASPK